MIRRCFAEEVKRKLRARLEAYQRQTNDPRITGDMAVFEETLKFVQGRKSAGYSDTRTPSKKNVPLPAASQSESTSPRPDGAVTP
jgi:hypothetical protein